MICNQCFKADKVTQGELGTPERLGDFQVLGVAVAQGELCLPGHLCVAYAFRTMFVIV